MDSTVSSFNGSAPIRVLLVEDNRPDAMLLRETLQDAASAQFKLTHVESRSAALALLCRENFDVVLLDLGLPESRGLDTFLYFHAHAPQVATIVLSGLNDEDVAVATVQKGAQDYLVKGRADGDLLVRAMRYAIERKRGQEELRLRNEQLQEDLNLAREFQLAFLPRQYPRFPSGSTLEASRLRFHHLFQPSSEVSGDFFDVLPLSDTQAGVFICDVMGHGVRAALVTTLIRGLLEECRPAAAEPGRFLAQINESLAKVLRQTGSTMFATAFYMVADAANARVSFASAGHPSPLLLRCAAGAVERIYAGNEPPGAVLGLIENSHYPGTEKSLSPGDVVLLYTDGIREVTNAAGEEFGLDRLLGAVRQRLRHPPVEMLRELVAEALEFSAARAFDDDVCLVTVEWDGAVR